MLFCIIGRLLRINNQISIVSQRRLSFPTFEQKCTEACLKGNPILKIHFLSKQSKIVIFCPSSSRTVRPLHRILFRNSPQLLPFLSYGAFEISHCFPKLATALQTSSLRLLGLQCSSRNFLPAQIPPIRPNDPRVPEENLMGYFRKVLPDNRSLGSFWWVLNLWIIEKRLL